jgi:hypothetical protein
MCDFLYDYRYNVPDVITKNNPLLTVCFSLYCKQFS